MTKNLHIDTVNSIIINILLTLIGLLIYLKKPSHKLQELDLQQIDQHLRATESK